MIRLASRSLIETRSSRRTWAARGLAGVARPAVRLAAASVVAARRNHCSEACCTWPNWWRITVCSTAGGRTSDDRLDEVAIAGVGRDPARAGVRVGEQAVDLEVGEDVPDRGAGHAEAVARDERLGADRKRRSRHIPR